jgi:uncharacterized protein (TIGR00369 family)
MSQPASSQPPGPPFLLHLGGRITDLQEGGEVIIELRREYCNSRQVAHGGVVMTILDVCMARAARARRRGDGQPDLGVATVEMKTTFLSPGTGSTLIARGTCLHRTATLAFCEAEVRDEQAGLVARASGTFKFITARKTP